MLLELLKLLFDPGTLLGLWFLSLLFTWVVEIPVFVQLVRGTVPWPRAAIAGAAGTLLTHPLLWFVWPRIVGPDYTVYVGSGELTVGVVESLTFFALARPVSFWRAVSTSFLANAASYGLGVLVLHPLLGY